MDVTVVTAGGTSATSTADQFTYVALPTVTKLNPTKGPVAGTSVVITGTNLSGASEVDFGSTAATSFVVNGAGTQITVTSPAGTGTVDVTVVTAGGTSATSTADQFTYVAAPTVTGLNPTMGPVAGTSVVITGTNLGGASEVDFGSTPVTSFVVNGAGTQLTVTSPAGTGTEDVTVVTAGGTSATSTADQFTYVALPTVTKLNPTMGPVAGGTSVVITGTNLSGASAVDFGSTPVTSFAVNGAGTQITVTSPGGTGTVDVTVVTAGGTSATSSADRFTYYIPAPTVTALGPTTGPTLGGTTVTITGTNLSGASAVDFGSTPVTSFVVNGAGTQITVTSPAGTGTVDVTVVTAGGTSATSSADRFTYYIPAPTVTALGPTTGPTLGGTTVTITGTNLDGATAVTFGGITVSIQSDTATQIVVTSPAGVAGTVDVRVSTAGGPSATSSADRFTYYVLAPTVAALSPLSGSTLGGTTVTITGTNLDGATAVTFGSITATIQSDTATQIVVTSPAGAAGTVDVTVTTAGGALRHLLGRSVHLRRAASGWRWACMTRPVRRSCCGTRTIAALPTRSVHTAWPGPDVMPIAGDWNGDGIESIGLYDPVTSTFYLRNTNCLQGPDDPGYADCVFIFGPANAGVRAGGGRLERGWPGYRRPVRPGDLDVLPAELELPARPERPRLCRHRLQLWPGQRGNVAPGRRLGRQRPRRHRPVQPSHFDVLPAGDDPVARSERHGLCRCRIELRRRPSIGLLPIAGDWNGDGKDGIGLYDQATSIFFLRNAIQLQGPSDHGLLPI